MRQTSQRGPKGYACPQADAIVGDNQPTDPFSSLTLLYPYGSKELFLEERNGNRNVDFCVGFADMKKFSYLYVTREGNAIVRHIELYIDYSGMMLLTMQGPIELQPYYGKGFKP